MKGSKVTAYHMHISVEDVLKMKSNEIAEIFVSDDGAPVDANKIKTECFNRSISGVKFFTGCDNEDEHGKCAGHHA